MVPSLYRKYENFTFKGSDSNTRYRYLLFKYLQITRRDIVILSGDLNLKKIFLNLEHKLTWNEQSQENSGPDVLQNKMEIVSCD